MLWLGKAQLSKRFTPEPQNHDHPPRKSCLTNEQCEQLLRDSVCCTQIAIMSGLMAIFRALQFGSVSCGRGITHLKFTAVQ